MEWTGIRQDPAIREWSSNAAADELFAQAMEARRQGDEVNAAELFKAMDAEQQVGFSRAQTGVHK